MEKYMFIVTILAIYGAYLNSIGKKEGFLIWIMTNLIFFINNAWIEQWSQALLFMTYFIISINGYTNAHKRIQI